MKKFSYTISNENGFNGPGITDEDYYFGGTRTIDGIKERRRKRSWRSDTPTEEPQVMMRYDSYGCLTYSGQNAMETDAIAQINDGDLMMEKVLKELDFLDENGKPDFCEDFNVLLSGTIPHVGNSQGNVNMSFRRDSLIPNKMLRFTHEMDQAKYNDLKRITPDMKTKAKKLQEFCTVEWQRLPYVSNRPYAKPEDIYEALGYLPMQVIVDSSRRNIRDGLIAPNEIYNYNHAQELVAAEWKKSFTVLDSYQTSRGDTKSFYKTYAWDYAFGWPIQYSFSLIKGIEDVEGFLRDNEGKFVQGSGAAIWLIQNGKKRAFTHYFDFLLFNGAKGVARRISDSLLQMIDRGTDIDPRESPNWKFVGEKYEMLKEMAQPDNIKRLQSLIEEGKRVEGQTWTFNSTAPDFNKITEPSKVSLLQVLLDFIKSFFK